MQELINEINQTKTRLTAAINAFNEAEFNQVPFEGSWTPAEVSEHISKASAPEVLYGPTKETTRQPDEKVAQLKSIFLDFSTRMKSPDFILPSGDAHTKEEMIKGLEEKCNGFAEAAATLNLNETCTAFEMPGMGHLTRLELITFFLVHTQRHTHQLEEIKKKI